MPRSAAGQDGDTPPAPRTLHPKHPSAGMKDAHHPLYHEGEPPHLPPGEPHTWLTKDPTDMTGTGPSGVRQSPLPASFPL